METTLEALRRLIIAKQKYWDAYSDLENQLMGNQEYGPRTTLILNEYISTLASVTLTRQDVTEAHLDCVIHLIKETDR